MSMKQLPHPSSHRTWVEIDLSAIADNIRRYRALVGNDCLIMPAVKADAYGHGAIECARAALAGGADRLAVATCREGEALREAGIGVPIQVLGAVLPEEVGAMVRYNLTVSLHDVDIACLIALEAVKRDTVIPVQFKIDTGMGRLGILPENAARAAEEIRALPGLRFEGVFMHFADASDLQYSAFQLARFERATQGLEEAGVTGFIRHAASSAAVHLVSNSAFDMIRPGAGVYGYLSPEWALKASGLRPALSWRAVVIQVKDYPPGSNLGYNRTFTTRRPSRVAVLAVGYADGYRRECSNRAQVLIRGRRAPVVGMVSMDYAMADVTDFGDEELGPGTVATLVGRDRDDCITAGELADWGGTIPYCVTTGLGHRVTRVYAGDMTTD